MDGKGAVAGRSPRPTDIGAREALILGQPPRIAARDIAECFEEAQALSGRLSLFSPEPAPQSVGEVAEVVATMLRHPEAYGRQVELGIQLGPQGSIPFRERELIILRIGWLCQAPFEWGEHVRIAKTAGLTTADVERVTHGPDAPGWTLHECAVLSAVDELITQAMICDATWEVLARSYDDRQLIELPLLVGNYQLVAYWQNALRVRLNAGNIGLKAR